MNTHEQKFRFKNAFWIVVLVLLTANLSYFDFRVNGDETVDKSDARLAYCNIDDGYS